MSSASAIALGPVRRGHGSGGLPPFKELVSSRVGLIAALLTAVNPFLVWYSQEARSYALLALLGALSLLFFVRALNSPSRRSVVVVERCPRSPS